MNRRPYLGAVVAVCTLLLGGCAGARTAESGPLSPGDRVRLTAPSVVDGEVKGEVQEISQDALLVSLRREEELVIPLEALGSLAVQRGTRRRVKEGALIGLGTGALTFLAILASEGGCGGDSMCESVIGWVAGVLTAGGALVGTVVGLLIETEIWEDRALPLTVEATPNGLGFGIQIPVGRND